MLDSRDLVIVGAGLVGLCAALAMQSPGRSITILEAGELDAKPGGGLNARSIALSLSSVKIFQALGIWSQIESAACAIETIHISSRGQFGVSRLRAKELQLDALGYVIENESLIGCLLDAVDNIDGVDLQQGVNLKSLVPADRLSIQCDRKGRTLQYQAAMLLVADGAKSTTRDLLGIDNQLVEYGQFAMITNLEVSRAKPSMAFERFLDTGPLALLPLGENKYSCIWTLTPQMAEYFIDCPEQEFIGELQRQFGYRLGYIDHIGERHVFPIQRICAQQLYRGRSVLLGNSANSLHPVAGQSFNLALRDIAALYDVFAAQELGALSGNEFEALADKYQQLRKHEQQEVIRLGDGLIGLFSNNFPGLGPVRGLGLALLDVLPPLKAQVAMAGMGMAGTGSHMLRGRL
ncbi:MAG: 2-octaprenyl-6-methoxyphenol hydroxylase [Gammaproteobacteria bacterium]|jgi:2-octaprenyl-6-methoxyphenol hydroxylase